MTYTKVQIENLIGIKKTRLQEWIDRGYIQPSIQKASGKGIVNIFSRNDIYQVYLFSKLLERGLTRLEAASQARINFKNVGPEKAKYKFCYFLSGKTNDDSIEKSEGGLAKEPPIVDMDSYRFMFIINLCTIKDEVDLLLAG